MAIGMSASKKKCGSSSLLEYCDISAMIVSAAQVSTVHVISNSRSPEVHIALTFGTLFSILSQHDTQGAIMANDGIDRKMEERLEFNTSKEVTV